MAIETIPKTANHLVLFVHGHDGHPRELDYISTQLKQKYPRRIIAYSVTSFDGKTHDGIDNGGRLVASEIQQCMSTLSEQGVVIKYVSFVGHSLGGLVSRYAIGVLYANKFFDNVKPMNFTTFATPHLGARKPVTGFSFDAVYSSTFNFLAPTLAGGRSIAQLFLEDDYDGQPLLAAMAEEDSDYFQALRLFPHKSTYANITLDYVVPYYAAAISDLDFTPGAHPCITGYKPVIYDLDKHVAAPDDPTADCTEQQQQLALQDCQRSMIKTLNSLHWAKYPVHIHNTWNSHTAILVFKVWDRKTCEGNVVVRHYADHFVESDDS